MTELSRKMFLAETAAVREHLAAQEQPTPGTTPTEPADALQRAEHRLSLAHQARRAKEHQLDDIRRALCDAGFMRDDDPYSHADLADVIRQTAPAETALNEQAEAEVARLRAGEEPGWNELTEPTPGQWIARWNSASAEERLDVAKRIIGNAAQASKCFEMNHENRLEAAEDRALRAEKRADQLEESLGIAHDTSNRSEAEHTRAVQRAEHWERAAGEIGKLYAAAENQRDEARTERDGAYRERAHLLAWLATLHQEHAVLAPAVDIDDDGWWLLFLTVAGRQLSWHIAPRDVELLNHVERVHATDPRAQWDGHTTEEKYQRIRTLPWGEMRAAVRTPTT